VYHDNGLETGIDPSGTRLQPLSSAWTSPVLDGQLYGEPLVYGGHVFVATESDTVYALDARTGAIVWSHHLGSPVPASDLPCGDITPTVGITGTPVIDPARNEIFVVADELSGSAGAVHHLSGLNLGNGAIELDEAVDPPGMRTTAQLQRPGLALTHGQVLVSYGGNYGDCSYYHGWLVAVPAGGGTLRTFELDSAAGDDQGAIWLGGAGPVVDSSGDIWVSVGNGSVHSSSPPWTNYDDSDSVLELSPRLALLQFFAPATWASDNVSDFDLGSAQVALVGRQAFIAGKSHIAFLLDRSHLGGIGHEEAQMPICDSDPDGGIAQSGSTVYVPCGSGLEAVRITESPAGMRLLWQTSTGSSGPAVIASGLIWTISQSGDLYGLSPATGNAVVTESIGSVANHFPTPTVADGLLLAPASDQVDAFKGPAGLPPSPHG
jgi:outer membrane protein assembly factor BamB